MPSNMLGKDWSTQSLEEPFFKGRYSSPCVISRFRLLQSSSLFLGDLIVLGLQPNSPQSFETAVDSLARWTHNNMVKSFHLSIVCFYRLCLDPTYGNDSHLSCQVAQYTSDRNNGEGLVEFYWSTGPVLVSLLYAVCKMMFPSSTPVYWTVN